MATLSGGEHGTFDAAATAGGRRGRSSLFATVSRAERDGFDLTPTTPDTTGVHYTRHDGFGRYAFRPAPSLTLTATGSGYWNTQSGRVVGEAGLLDSVVDDESQAANVNANWQPGGRTSVESRFYWTRFAETNAGTLVATQLVQPADKLYESLVKGDATLSHVLGERHLVQGGAEISGDDYRGVNRVRDDDGHEVTTSVAWAQDRFSLASWLTLTVGGRYDYHSTFGSAFSSKAAVNARVVEGVRLRASYGEGFRAPDLGQLFYRFVPSANFYQVIGNPDLEPEYAESWQAGADYSTDPDASVSASTHFATTSTISSRPIPSGSSPRRRSSPRCSHTSTSTHRSVLSSGVSCSSTATSPTRGRRVSRWTARRCVAGSLQIAGAYTYLDALDLTRNQPLAGRHRHQGHARLTWVRAPLGLRAEIRGTFYSSWLAVASRGAGDAGVTAPGFALWDAYASKRIAGGLEAFGAIDNLADNQDPNTDRLLPAGTPAPIYRPEIGRTIRFGVRWTFDKK